MKIEDIKSCYDSSLIKKERRCGNTTRLADNAIKILFEDSAVRIQDHFNLTSSNHRLFDIIHKRLVNEHHFVDLQTVNKNRLVIAFKKLNIN